jgi:hypothetical protein
MDIKKLVAERSDTHLVDWEFMNGPETGVGTEYWLYNDEAGLEAYVCVDQGQVTSCKITDPKRPNCD